MLREQVPGTDASVATILGDLADSTQTLLRQQVELVKVETTEKITEQVQSKGRAVGFLAGGALFALLGLAFLGVMLIFGLQSWFSLSGWVAALIVTVIYFAIGGVLAFMGKQALQPHQDLVVEPELPELRHLSTSH